MNTDEKDSVSETQTDHRMMQARIKSVFIRG